MNEMDPRVLITFITVIISGVGIVIGNIVPTVMQGKAVQKALDGIARQPESANDLRTTLLIAMALLESGAIYTLLIILILLFANPLIDRFF